MSVQEHWEELKDAFLRVIGRPRSTVRLIRRHELIDEEFMSMCAPWSDGRVMILKGFGNNDKLHAVLNELVAAGEVARPVKKEETTAEELRNVWAGRPVQFDEGDPEIRKRIKAIFTDAADAKASDVMFELSDEACDVFVIANDKKLRLGERMTVAMGERMMGFLFHIRDAGSAQTSYQRGSFQGFSLRNRKGFPLPEIISGLRCQRGPHEPERDHMFCRIFYRNQIPENITLESLGFSRDQADIFAEIRQSLQGAVFIGGTTGDGKSTTLAANMQLQFNENNGEVNLVTVEDPVEYPIPGAVQIAVPTTGSGEERAKHYVQALMHFCRVHPASGMVSEIRDGDAARQVLQFVDSGHQVWTTIHVSNANSILFRLIDLGVNPGEVCKPGNIALLAQQTLVPMLCHSCRLDESTVPVPNRLADILKDWKKVYYRNPKGCTVCTPKDAKATKAAAWAGYQRPKVIAEMIRPDAGYLEFVRDRNASGALDYWISEMKGLPLDAQIWREIFLGNVDPIDGTRKGATYREGRAYGDRVRREYLRVWKESGHEPEALGQFLRPSGLVAEEEKGRSAAA